MSCSTAALSVAEFMKSVRDGGIGGPGESGISITIPAMSTVDADSNVEDSFKGLFYRIFAETSDLSKSRGLLCIVSRKSGEFIDEIGMRVGELKFSIENESSSGYHRLRIGNMENQPITVVIKKEIF